MWSQSRPGLDGLGQDGNAQTRDQVVPHFWENPRPGPGPLGLVRSRPGPNWSGKKLPQHYYYAYDSLFHYVYDSLFHYAYDSLFHYGPI